MAVKEDNVWIWLTSNGHKCNMAGSENKVMVAIQEAKSGRGGESSVPLHPSLQHQLRRVMRAGSLSELLQFPEGLLLSIFHAHTFNFHKSTMRNHTVLRPQGR